MKKIKLTGDITEDLKQIAEAINSIIDWINRPMEKSQLPK